MEVIPRAQPGRHRLDLRMTRLYGVARHAGMRERGMTTPAHDHDDVRTTTRCCSRRVRAGAEGVALKEVSWSASPLAFRTVDGGDVPSSRPKLTSAYARGRRASRFDSAERPEALTDSEKDHPALLAAVQQKGDSDSWHQRRQGEEPHLQAVWPNSASRPHAGGAEGDRARVI